jgi:hypothetical protein
VSRARKPRASAGAKGRWWRIALPVIGGLLTLLVAGGVVLAVSLLGTSARDQIGPRDRYEVRFADIDCDPPPGTDRDTFLVEVRSASQFPESFQLLAPDRDDRLRAAFAAHPWVESVDGIDADPPAQVKVRLKYRTPELVVVLTDGGVRTVDARGVLLPLTAKRDGLPVLASPVPPPAVEAGHPWPGNTVKRAVELVAAYHPRTLQWVPTGWMLVMMNGKVLMAGP